MMFEERMAILTKIAKEQDGLETEEAQNVFSYMCSSETWYESVNVLPVRLIAAVCGYSKYMVRKQINLLRKLGLVERTTCGCPAIESNTESGYDMWCEASPPLNGFGLTKKGYESFTYKKADEIQDEEYRAMCSSGGEDIERY